MKVTHQPLHSLIRVNWEFSSNCDFATEKTTTIRNDSRINSPRSVDISDRIPSVFNAIENILTPKFFNNDDVIRNAANHDDVIRGKGFSAISNSIPESPSSIHNDDHGSSKKKAKIGFYGFILIAKAE